MRIVVLAADDKAAIHFHGSDYVETVSSQRDAAAYRVTVVDGKCTEERLDTRFLGT